MSLAAPAQARWGTGYVDTWVTRDGVTVGRADRGEQVALRVQIMAVAASQRSCTLHGIAMSGDDAVILALSSA